VRAALSIEFARRCRTPLHASVDTKRKSLSLSQFLVGILDFLMLLAAWG